MPNPYNCNRWKNLRARFLALHPTCTLCKQRGIITPATVVDHVTPHRGDEVLMWDESNLQGLCSTCHSSAKQRLERSGSLPGSDLTGIPLDPRHPWHRDTDE